MCFLSFKLRLKICSKKELRLNIKNKDQVLQLLAMYLKITIIICYDASTNPASTIKKSSFRFCHSSVSSYFIFTAMSTFSSRQWVRPLRNIQIKKSENHRQ